MDWIFDTVWNNRTWNDIYTIVFYWFPSTINLIVYTFRSWGWYISDRKAATDKEKFHTYMKLGDIVGWFFASIIPIVNCFTFVFSTMASTWEWVTKKLWWIMEYQFVKKPNFEE